MNVPDSNVSVTGQRPLASWPLIFAAVNGLLAVAGGALVAHRLAAVMTEADLATLNTALDYQSLQGLALLILAIWDRTGGGGIWVRRGCQALALGVCLFSGSLYLLVFTDWRPFAFLTPVGGIALLAGWSFLLMAAMSPAPIPKEGKP